jgi:hypothetical protein
MFFLSFAISFLIAVPLYFVNCLCICLVCLFPLASSLISLLALGVALWLCLFLPYGLSLSMALSWLPRIFHGSQSCAVFLSCFLLWVFFLLLSLLFFLLVVSLPLFFLSDLLFCLCRFLCSELAVAYLPIRVWLCARTLLRHICLCPSIWSYISFFSFLVVSPFLPMPLASRAVGCPPFGF